MEYNKVYLGDCLIEMQNIPDKSIDMICKNLNRNFILIEREQEYIDIINKRLTPPRGEEEMKGF